MNIFYTVNSGLYFQDERCGIFVDGLHEGKSVGFSATPREIRQQLHTHTGIFRQDNLYLFSHNHPDHFSPDLVRQLRNFEPDSMIFGPMILQSNARPQFISDGIRRFCYHNWTVFLIDAIHDGQGFERVPLNTFLIQTDHQSFFIASDAIISATLYSRIQSLSPAPITAAFVNIYQLASQTEQAYLHALSPERIWLYHMQFPQDDSFGLWQQAIQIQERLPAGFPKTSIMEPMRMIPV